MKKPSLVVLTLLWSGLMMSAQNEWLPKGEFTVNLFGGPTTLAGWKTAPNAGYAGFADFSTPANAALFDAKRLAGGVGLGYIWHFNDWVGLATGVDFSLYRDFYGADALYGGARYNWYSYYAQGENDFTYTNSAEWFKVSGFREKALMGAVQIPILFQVTVPLSQRIHLYANLGATLAFNVWGQYTQHFVSPGLREGGAIPGWGFVSRGQRDGDVVYHDGNPGPFSYFAGSPTGVPVPGTIQGSGIPTPQDGVELIDDDAYHQLQGDNAWARGEDIKGKLDLNLFDVKASAEIGFRWAIARNFALYTGVYLDYGLLSALKNSNRGLIDNSERRASLDNYDNRYKFSTYHYPNQEPGLVYNPVDATADGIADGAPESHSVFNAVGAPGVSFYEDSRPEYPGVRARLADPQRYVAGGAHSCGIKLRFAFGNAPAPAPEPVIQYVERIVRDTVVNTVVQKDTVVNTVIQRDTVTNTVVVRDTVTIIKEVPVEIRKVMADLSNSLFDTGKAVIKDAAKGPLYTVVMWLKENPNAKVEVSGHTDNVGSPAYNQDLSERRAKAVYDYFVASGVDASRLSYAGYGMDRPIATNDTPEGRQQNRRVELNVIE